MRLIKLPKTKGRVPVSWLVPKSLKIRKSSDQWYEEGERDKRKAYS